MIFLGFILIIFFIFYLCSKTSDYKKKCSIIICKINVALITQIIFI